MKRYHIEVGKLKTPEEFLQLYQQLGSKFEVIPEHYEMLDDKFKALCVGVEEDEDEDEDEHTAPYTPWYNKVLGTISVVLTLIGASGGLLFIVLAILVLLTQ